MMQKRWDSAGERNSHKNENKALAFARGACRGDGRFGGAFASHGAAAEDELEGIDDFYDAIPDEVAELLPEDFFTSEPTRLAAAVHEAAGGKNLLDAALAAIGGGIGASVRLFATLCGVALAAAVLGSVRELAAPRGLGGAITLIINAAAAVAAVGTQYVSFEAISAYFERQRLIMSALLPLMGVLYAMGGNSGGAALNNSTVLLWLELIGLSPPPCSCPPCRS